MSTPAEATFCWQSVSALERAAKALRAAGPAGIAERDLYHRLAAQGCGAADWLVLLSQMRALKLILFRGGLIFAAPRGAP